MNHSQLLINTAINCKNNLTELGIDSATFCEKLFEYGGLITGSFVFANFGIDPAMRTFGAECPGSDCNFVEKRNFYGKKAEFNDIDVYFYHDKNHKDFPNDKHPFQEYIVNNITKQFMSKSCYSFTDGITYTMHYIADNFRINFIALSTQPMEQVSRFDLDCCKITFDGKVAQCESSIIDDLIMGKTMYVHEDCDINKLYMGGKLAHPIHGKMGRKMGYTDQGTVYQSESFIKLKMFYEIYTINKKFDLSNKSKYQIIADDSAKDISSYISKNCSTYVYKCALNSYNKCLPICDDENDSDDSDDDDNKENYCMKQTKTEVKKGEKSECYDFDKNEYTKQYSIKDYLELYSGFIPYISNYIDLEHFFFNEFDIKKPTITSNTAKIISIIRLLERIEKYKNRGIESFVLKKNF